MSNRPDPQVTPAEAAVRLRAHPPSPKRLSRKVLMAGTGAIGLVIAFALVTCLSPRSEAASQRSETAPPAAAALPEGLSRLPARYETGALTQYNSQAEEPYDRLWGPDGPPEHLDLDPEGYEDALSLPEGSDWGLQDLQEQATTVQAGTFQASPARGPAPADLFFKRREPSAAFAVNAQAASGVGATSITASAQTYLSATPGPPPGPPYLIQSGSVIPAALLTAVNSDLPGRVIAQVSAPVYDSVTGDHLLIPQGARLIGTYSNENSYGDTRVFLSWDRLLMPDGGSPGVGGEGGDRRRRRVRPGRKGRQSSRPCWRCNCGLGGAQHPGERGRRQERPGVHTKPGRCGGAGSRSHRQPHCRPRTEPQAHPPGPGRRARPRPRHR